MAVIVDGEKCTGCGQCADGCPSNAIIVENKAKIKEDECVECGLCVEECPQKALSLP
jgi:NAD-dependent dihydropyrimidine dehydrogenase PreA subunit